MPNYIIEKLSRSGNASYLKVCILITDMKDVDWIRTPADFVREFKRRIQELDVKRALSVKHGYRARVMNETTVEITHHRLDGTPLYPTHKITFK